MKIFASDFDNTLHFRDKENHGYFKTADLEAIESFRKDGNLFGLCTGRPGNGFGADMVGGPEMDFMIVSTGSLIWNDKHETLYEARIPVEDIKELKSLIGEDDVLYIHADGDVYTLYFRRHEYPQQTVLNSIDDLAEKHITGVSVNTPSFNRASELTKELNQKFKCDLIAFQNGNWLDVIRKNNSKGIAAIKAKEIYHADLLAGIGDNFNDIELIRKADVSFTFPYAPKPVQEEADYIVDNVAEAISIFRRM